jgi:alpha-L-rhamnosidase
MLGSVGAWLYKALAGINVHPEEVGFKKVQISPQVVGDLEYAEASIWTLRGNVASSWKVSQTDGTLKLGVSIPVNSEAELLLPKGYRPLIVREGGKVVWQKSSFHSGVSGVAGAVETDKGVLLSLGSGRYSFDIREE